MNRYIAIVLAALVLSTPAVASEVHLGTITATTVKNNANTAVPFGLAERQPYAIQCDVAVYVLAQRTVGGTVTSATGVKVAADELFDIDLALGQQWISILPVTGTAVCKVFLRLGEIQGY